ncbi:hypothetical protein GCM10007092_03930 [Thermus composti]|nr:hypothetical protein GCM10007092_03930 [Thermus composti]
MQERSPGPLILYSLFTGALAGGGAALFGLSLKALGEGLGKAFGYLPPEAPGEGGLAQAFLGPSPWALALLLPLLYGGVSFLGSGLGLTAFLLLAREGKAPPPLAPLRALLGSLLQLALYSPMGREGPMGLLGLWLGEALDRRFPRVGGGLAFAGLAAGLGAALHAPVAGALLATEVLYRGLYLEAKALTPALLGALAGFAVYGALLGYAPLVPLPVEADLKAFLPGMLLGLLAAGLGALWIEGARLLRGALGHLPHYLRHGLLGLGLAASLLFLPEALGPGVGWLAVALTPLLTPKALGLLLLAKFLLLVLALGVRAYGAPYTPALVLGGLLGVLLARLLPLGLSPEAGALAAGAALLAGTARAPFAALALAAEWGGYGALPLVLPAVFLAYALTPGADPLEEAREALEGQKPPPSERPPQSASPPPGPEDASGPETPPG